MDPGDFHLPAILDPILDYLESSLPRLLYTFLLNTISHCLALLSALVSLLLSLLSRNPTEWDAQTVLPPLIGVLAAYLALTSIYRTTTWFIRTSFWVMKWGFIVGGLAVGMGWYMGGNQAGGLIDSGFVSHLGNLVMDAINGDNRNAIGHERYNHVYASRSPPKSTNKRPKIWESFDRHNEWQYNEDQTEMNRGSDLETLFNNLIDVAGQMVGEVSWWSGMKKLMENEAAEEGSKTRGQAKSKSQ
ncbi:hypothetical protein AN958_04675 [Leucoagaricus sp. SymC.cos]|nr:hypothetical protein AN958_04675 [Leucoagaricus sp. SymC.cos]